MLDCWSIDSDRESFWNKKADGGQLRAPIAKMAKETMCQGPDLTCLRSFTIWTRTAITLASMNQYWPTRSLDPALPRTSAALGPVNE